MRERVLDSRDERLLVLPPADRVGALLTDDGRRQELEAEARDEGERRDLLREGLVIGRLREHGGRWHLGGQGRWQEVGCRPSSVPVGLVLADEARTEDHDLSLDGRRIARDGVHLHLVGRDGRLLDLADDADDLVEHALDLVPAVGLEDLEVEDGAGAAVGQGAGEGDRVQLGDGVDRGCC